MNPQFCSPSCSCRSSPPSRGPLGRHIGRVGAHSVAIAGVGLSSLSLKCCWQIYWQGVPAFDAPVYTWLVSDSVTMQVGFLIDRLSALMMAVVTFVSLCVHVYTIGYMRDDPGYQSFFSYISLFTFRHADAGDGEQLHAAVLRPGSAWSSSLSADGFW